jgi:hypothetical protein
MGECDGVGAVHREVAVSCGVYSARVAGQAALGSRGVFPNPSFRVGERVKFQPDGSPELLGTLTRYNKQTVTVVTDAGQHWNVSPSLLTRANPPTTANPNGAAVARFPGRHAEK